MCVVCLVKTREMNQWRGKETTGAARKEGMAAEMILVVAGSLAVGGDGGRRGSRGRPRGWGQGWDQLPPLLVGRSQQGHF